MNPAKRAAQLLAAHGGQTLPVPAESIAQALGYRLARARHDGGQCSFVARSAVGDTVLGINTARGVRSQRFAVAHALGHAELAPRDLVVCHEIRIPGGDGPADAPSGEEEAASRFAAELLMPSGRVFAEAGALLPDDRGGREALVKALSATFGVTSEAMAFRLVDLAVLVP